MPIKNYTTEIPAIKSIGEIQGNLVSHGAKSIMIDYDDKGQAESLSFIIPTPQGEIPFRLPANTAAVVKLLKGKTDPNFRRWDDTYQKQRAERILKQADRVAWRILKDWVDAQLAIIETEMVTLTQVFLPYMQVSGKQTLYEAMVDRGYYLGVGDDKGQG